MLPALELVGGFKYILALKGMLGGPPGNALYNHLVSAWSRLPVYEGKYYGPRWLHLAFPTLVSSKTASAFLDSTVHYGLDPI